MHSETVKLHHIVFEFRNKTKSYCQNTTALYK